MQSMKPEVDVEPLVEQQQSLFSIPPIIHPLPGGDYSLVTSVQFADFLEARKHDLEWIGFDTGCVNVTPMRDALNQVYQEAKVGIRGIGDPGI